MRSFSFTAHATGTNQNQALDTLTDYPRYPQYTDTIQHVQILPNKPDQPDQPDEPGRPGGPDGPLRSRWALAVHGGLMHCTLSTRINRHTAVITFEQEEGDLDVLRGQWHLSPTQNGIHIALQAQFDVGIPVIADILEPIACHMLTKNIESILRGLFGHQHIHTHQT